MLWTHIPRAVGEPRSGGYRGAKLPRAPLGTAFFFGIIRAMLKIDVISVQPKMFEGFLTESIVARAVKKGACEVNIVDLREFGEGRWRKVDDSPYGGGPGMLMKCGPWFAAVESRVGTAGHGPGVRVVMTSPAGRKFTQRDAESLAAAEHVIFMCGHYEGFDARIETLATDLFSVGDFVMTGGELAAAAMVDATVRLLPGVLGGGPAATASHRASPPRSCGSIVKTTSTTDENNFISRRTN